MKARNVLEKFNIGAGGVCGVGLCGVGVASPHTAAIENQICKIRIKKEAVVSGLAGYWLRRFLG